jgi:hypothetical protein
MPRRTKTGSQRILVVSIAVGIVAAVVGVNAILASQQSSTEDYVRQLQKISDQSMALTSSYEDSIGKWKNGLIDDEEMLGITDSNLQQLESLASKLKSLEPPEKFREGHEMGILSLQYELESNRHLRNYIVTGDEEEYKKSNELFQLAFDYESKAFEAFSKANKIT